MDSINLAKYILLIFLTVFVSSRVIAEAYYCKVTEYGFQHAMGAARLSLKQMEYWMPKTFYINPNEAKFWSDGTMKVTGGNRTSTFQVKNFNTTADAFYDDTYYIKVNSYSNTGTLTLKSPGYHTIGPVRYICEAAKGASSAQVPSSNNRLRTEFQKLSKCNKKYLQQFLKGQGLYFSDIDGLWGKGTERAVNSALKLPTFKNTSPNEFFKKIQQNPICN